MNSIVCCEWSISRLYVDSAEVSDDNPVKEKLRKALELLGSTENLKNQRVIRKIEVQAWASLLPMQLEVHFTDGDIFDLAGQVTIDITDTNTSWGIWASDESVGFNLSVKFKLETIKKITDKQLSAWERKHGWDCMEISIASEGYEGDNGSDIRCTLAEE